MQYGSIYITGAPERIIDRCSTFLNAEGNVSCTTQNHAYNRRLIDIVF